MTSLKGNLNSVDLANIFQMLAMNQSEGTLSIFDGASKKSIYFGHDGVSVLTSGEAKHDSLGRVLLRHDRIAPEQLTEALKRQKETGAMMLGQVFVEQGFVTRQEVEEALQIQIEEEIYNLFIWKDAQFEFVEGPPPAEFQGGDGYNKVAFNVNSLIMEAAQRVDEWEWIQTIVQSLNGIYRYSGRNVDLDDPIFQEPYAGKVLNAIDGSRTVKEIIEVSYVNTFEVCKIVSLLTEGGAVEPVPVPELRKSADAAVAAGDTASALKFLSRIVELEGDTPDMHRQLAEVYEGEQELAKAAFHYKVFAEVQVDGGDIPTAFRIYHRIVSILPTDLSAADRMIEIFSINPDGLEEHAQEIIDQGKLLAECYVELGRTSRAVAVLHRVVSLGSEDVDLRNRLIQVYLASGMTGEAIAEYEALAESMFALGELQEATRIYRKILSIDPSRDDITTRLNQVLRRSRRRARNVKAAVLTLLFLGAVGVGAVYGLRWFQGWEEGVAETEQKAAARLHDAANSHTVVIGELQTLIKDLNAHIQDPDKLSEILQTQEAARERVRKTADAALREYAQLATEFEGTQAAKDSENNTEALNGLVRTLDRTEQGAIDRLAQSAKELSAQALALHENGESMRKVLARLQRAVHIAAPCKQWNNSEDGIRAREFEKNLRETLDEFETTVKTMDELVEAGDVATAFDTGMGFLCSFPPPELAAEIKLPIEFRSEPVTAQVFVNGADSGLTTPAVVRIPLRLGAEVELRASGFEPTLVSIDPVKAVDPKELRAETQRDYDVSLRKATAWTSRPLAGTIEATPTHAGAFVYVPTRGTSMEVLDLETGASVERIPTRSSNGVKARAIVSGDVIAAAAINKLVFFYSRGTHKYLGQYTAPGDVRTDLAEVGGRLLLADGSGHVTAVDPQTRTELWRFPSRGEIGKNHPFLGPVLEADDGLYAPLTNGVVYVLDPATGRRTRQFTITNKGKPVQLRGVPAIAGSHLFATLRGGHVLCVNRRTGRVVWTQSIAEEIVGSPCVKGGTVFVVGEGGQIAAMSTSDGTPAGSVGMPGRVSAPAALAGDMLVVGDSRGSVRAFDVSRGELSPLWQYDVRDDAGRPLGVTCTPLVTDGLVILGTSDRTVYAIRR